MTAELFINENPSHEVSKAFQVLQKKNKDMLDGLYYASFVQQGLMPQERHFKKNNNIHTLRRGQKSKNQK